MFEVEGNNLGVAETHESLGECALAQSGAESAAMFRSRMQTNRGDAYLGPTALSGKQRAIYNIPPSFVCDNVKAPIPYKRPETPTTDQPGQGHGASCYLEQLPLTDGPGKFPHLGAADYLSQVPPVIKNAK